MVNFLPTASYSNRSWNANFPPYISPSKNKPSKMAFEKYKPRGLFFGILWYICLLVYSRQRRLFFPFRRPSYFRSTCFPRESFKRDSIIRTQSSMYFLWQRIPKHCWEEWCSFASSSGRTPTCHQWCSTSVWHEKVSSFSQLSMITYENTHTHIYIFIPTQTYNSMVKSIDIIIIYIPLLIWTDILPIQYFLE